MNNLQKWLCDRPKEQVIDYLLRWGCPICPLMGQCETGEYAACGCCKETLEKWAVRCDEANNIITKVPETVAALRSKKGEKQ